MMKMKTLHFIIITIFATGFIMNTGIAFAQYGPGFYAVDHYPPTNDTKLELLVMNSTEFKQRTSGYNYTFAGVDHDWISKGNNNYDFGGARVTFFVFGFGNETTKGEAFNLDSQMNVKNIFEYDANRPPAGYRTDVCMGCPLITGTKPECCGPAYVQPTLDTPLKQFKSGIAANDVKCKHGLQLVIKAEDNSPSCVKAQTAQRLVERGWGWAMQPIDSLKPLLPNRIAGLENDTGIVTFGNRTYYFETPHYTQDAYVNPVQISFHGVVFTLFPSGFKGGLPDNDCGSQYYWTDAKFSDGTHELLHIFPITSTSQQCLALPEPTYFSTHTDPLAGLTFYDGKLKLLASVEGELQQNNSVFSTPIPTNETIYHDFPHPPGYPIINSTQGIVVNDDAEASNLTGFSVKSPTDLPQGYKVKLIKASKEIPMVTIFVSKYPLTENTTSEDFLWNQQGILITYDQIYPHELENFKQFFSASANKIITINGTLVVVSDISKEYHNGYPYDMWASLIAIKDNNTNIGIRGFFNSDDLIKIATSMLEK